MVEEEEDDGCWCSVLPSPNHRFLAAVAAAAGVGGKGGDAGGGVAAGPGDIIRAAGGAEGRV